MPKDVKSRGDKPKPPWEQGTVFDGSSGVDMTRLTAGQRAAEVLHAEKDEKGRSVQGVKNAKRTNAKKKQAEHNRLQARIEAGEGTTREETKMLDLREHLQRSENE